MKDSAKPMLLDMNRMYVPIGMILIIVSVVIFGLEVRSIARENSRRIDAMKSEQQFIREKLIKGLTELRNEVFQLKGIMMGINKEILRDKPKR